MALKKKSQIFTGIMVLVFIMVVALIPSPNIDQSYKDFHKWDDLIDRNTAMLGHIEDSILPKVSRTLSYCAMKTTAENDFGSNPSLDNIQEYFKNVFIGNIPGCDTNLTAFTKELSEVFRHMQLDFQMDAEDIEIRITETQPFFFNVHYNITYNLSVLNQPDLMFFRRVAVVNVSVPIYGITDPLSERFMGNPHKIAYSPGPSRKIFDYFFVFEVGLIDEDEDLMRCFNSTDSTDVCLERSLNYKWFYYAEEAPSFLDRLLLSPQSSSDCCGIMTLLNNSDTSKVFPGEVNHFGGQYNQSFVDFCYYQSDPPNCPHSNSTCKLLINISHKGKRVMIDAWNLHFITRNITWSADRLDPEQGAVIYEPHELSCLTE
jgi:hypothetical protein